MKTFVIIENREIVSKVIASVPPEGYVELTKELEDSLKTVYVTIKVPLVVFQQSADLQQKLAQMALLFSDIKRRPRGKYLVLSNINLADVPEFLSSKEYAQLTSVGVVFDERIDALFVNDQ